MTHSIRVGHLTIVFSFRYVGSCGIAFCLRNRVCVFGKLKFRDCVDVSYLHTHASFTRSSTYAKRLYVFCLLKEKLAKEVTQAQTILDKAKAQTCKIGLISPLQ